MLTIKYSEIDKTIASLTSLKQRLQQHVSAIENRFLCEEQAIYRKSVEEMMVAYVNISCECTPEVFNKHYVDLVSKIEYHGLKIVENRFTFFHGDIANMKYDYTNVTLYLFDDTLKENIYLHEQFSDDLYMQAIKKKWL